MAQTRIKKNGSNLAQESGRTDLEIGLRDMEGGFRKKAPTRGKGWPRIGEPTEKQLEALNRSRNGDSRLDAVQRRSWILERIMDYSMLDLRKLYREAFDVNRRTEASDFQHVFEMMEAALFEEAKAVRRLLVNRADHIYGKAVQDKDYKLALAATKEMGDLTGVHKEVVESSVDLSTKVVTVEFPDGVVVDASGASGGALPEAGTSGSIALPEGSDS